MGKKILIKPLAESL